MTCITASPQCAQPAAQCTAVFLHRDDQLPLLVATSSCCCLKLNVPQALLLPFAGFTVVLSLLLLFFGFVLHLSAVRGSTSSSSQTGHRSTTARPLLLLDQEAGTSVPAPAAALGLPCLQLLQQLLPQTNFSSLRTAELLDAAVNAQLGSFGTRQLAQLQQALFCQ
jgi:hypothetical protein